MLAIRVYRPGRKVQYDLDPARISEVLEEQDSLLWVDLASPTDNEFALLKEEFGFHPLSIEDAEKPHQRPRIVDYVGYVFWVFYGIKYDVVTNQLAAHEVASFAGSNFLVTVRKDPPLPIDESVKRWEARPDLLSTHSGFLVYTLLDQVVDDYFLVVDDFDAAVDEMEDRVFSASMDDHETMTKIFQLKRTLIQFRRLVVPMRDVMNVVVRRDIEVLTDDLLPYFQDVYDHLIRITDSIDTQRELLTNALEANLSVISNRMSEVMKKTSSWGAILLVSALIAGIYGMNFRHMPELYWYWGYPLAFGLMVACTVGLYMYFKRKGWI